MRVKDVADLVNEAVALLADVLAAVAVDLEVRLEGLVLLEQPLHGSHGVPVVAARQQVLLLADPRLLLLHRGRELLVGVGLLQLAPAVRSHVL